MLADLKMPEPISVEVVAPPDKSIAIEELRLFSKKYKGIDEFNHLFRVIDSILQAAG